MQALFHSHKGPYLIHSSLVQRTASLGVLRLATRDGVHVDAHAQFVHPAPSRIAEPLFIGSAHSPYELLDDAPLFVGSAYSASGFGDHPGYGLMSSGRSMGLGGADSFYFPPGETSVAPLVMDGLGISVEEFEAQERAVSAPTEQKRPSLGRRFGAMISEWLKSDPESHPHRRRRPF